MVVLPFDAHNHLQLGPTPVFIGGANDAGLSTCLTGMAVMSTHPRDYPILLEMERASLESSSSDNQHSVRVLPCLGVHPWFLHELGEDDWALEPSSSSSSSSSTRDADGADTPLPLVPKWVADLEGWLLAYPRLPVGEIGLDNFHFDPLTGQLTTPMDRQVEAFRYQLQLATLHRRPVSIHCVRAMGKIMDGLDEVYNYQKLHRLPPRIYFHAFGGKAATATQLINTLERRRRSNGSPKTVEVIQAVGLDRIVLETDHEDAARVGPSMKHGIEVIAKALSISQDDLVRVTNANVKDLYNIE